MIFQFLGKTLFGLKRGYWLAIMVGLVLAYFAYAAVLDRMTDNAKQVGAVTQQNDNLTQTIRNVEKANDAAENVRRDPDAGRAECLRNARNPADC